MSCEHISFCWRVSGSTATHEVHIGPVSVTLKVWRDNRDPVNDGPRRLGRSETLRVEVPGGPTHLVQRLKDAGCPPVVQLAILEYLELTIEGRFLAERRGATPAEACTELGS